MVRGAEVVEHLGEDRHRALGVEDLDLRRRRRLRRGRRRDGVGRGRRDRRRDRASAWAGPGRAPARAARGSSSPGLPPSAGACGTTARRSLASPRVRALAQAAPAACAGRSGAARPRARRRRPEPPATAAGRTGGSCVASARSSAAGRTSAATGAAIAASGGGSPGGAGAGVAVSRTFVPHPVGASSTVPLARSPSQATVVSGSTRVMRISPNSARWRPSESSLLSSAHSSGGDFTRRRVAVDCIMARGSRALRGVLPPDVDRHAGGGEPGLDHHAGGDERLAPRMAGHARSLGYPDPQSNDGNDPRPPLQHPRQRLDRRQPRPQGLERDQLVLRRVQVARRGSRPAQLKDAAAPAEAPEITHHIACSR